MKYVAFLRGINVGGNSIIRMTLLKEMVEKAGYTHVVTYIQSGNVIFASEHDTIPSITDRLETVFSKFLAINIRVVVFSYLQYKEIIADVPDEWKKRMDIRCYIAFIKPPVTTKDLLREIQLKEGVDTVKEGKGVIYMTTILSGLTKSGFTRLAGKKVYGDITIRNYNTAQKILSLME